MLKILRLASLIAAVQLISNTAMAQFVAPIRYNEGPGIKLTDSLVFHPGLEVEGRYDSNARYGDTSNPFVPVVGSFMEPRILGGRQGTFIGTIIEDQFTAVFNWPLGAALSFLMLGFVLLILLVILPLARRVS